MLTDDQKEIINNVATGQAINGQLSIPDQIGAIRKQVDLILEANPKIEICDSYKTLSEVVESEKAKKKETSAKLSKK